MSLDAADLAMLEVVLLDLKDDDLAKGIQDLVDEIRSLQDRNELLENLLVEAKDQAKDGKRALERLRDAAIEFDGELPGAFWKAEDEADDCFEAIRSLDE